MWVGTWGWGLCWYWLQLQQFMKFTCMAAGCLGSTGALSKDRHLADAGVVHIRQWFWRAGLNRVACCCRACLQVLTVQAEELVVVKFELQELRKEHVNLQITLEKIQRRMSTQHDDLAVAQ